MSARAKIPNAKASLIFLAYAAFIALGMPDSMFGVAWPTMRGGFGVPIDAMGTALIFATAGYLLSSFFSGKILSRFTVGPLLGFSSFLACTALVIDCWVPSWNWFVLVSFALGLAAGGIDGGLNTYVASEFGDRQMHWLHACYGMGVTIGPLLMTLGLKLFSNWRPGYLLTAGFQLGLAAAFTFSMSSGARKPGAKGKVKKTARHAPLLNTLSHFPVWLGLLLFFLYSGAEFSLGFWSYSILTESRGIAPVIAGVLAGSYYGMFMVGRILSGIYAKHISRGQIVRVSLGAALLGAVLLWLNLNPIVSLSGMVMTGFAIAPVFPSLVSGTSDRLGSRHAGNAIGMQMSAAGAGAACLPALMGILARHVSVESITAALVVLFGLILLLFLVSERLRLQRKSK